MKLEVLSRQADYFIRAAAFTSLREAAHYLGLTQPALTQAIQQLESQLQCQLFERSRNGVVLTPTGRLVLAELTELQQNAQKKLASAIATRTEPTLRIACQEHFFRRHLYTYIAATKNFPPYQLYFGNVFKTHEALENGDVDIALFAATERSKDLVYHAIKDDPFRIVGLKTKYAHIAKAKSVADLKDENWIDSRYRGFALFERPVGIATDTFSGLIMCVLLGLGIGAVQIDYFTDEQKLLLAQAPFTPNVNSPGHPLVPPGVLPKIYLVHPKRLPTLAKKHVEKMLTYFTKKFGPQK